MAIYNKNPSEFQDFFSSTTIMTESIDTRSSNKSGRRIRIQHGVLLAIAIVFSWHLWVLVNIPTYSHISGWDLVGEILSDLCQQAIETIILLELSLHYMKVIVNIFGKRRKI